MISFSKNMEEMNLSKTFCLIVLLLVCLCSRAKVSIALGDSLQQTTLTDSIDSLKAVTDTIPIQKHVKAGGNVCNTRFQVMAYTCAPLIINGLIIKGQSRSFRGLRNDYMPQFRMSLDNYTQYLPAAVMLGLKIGGVKSKNSWGRMLASDALSVALMAGIVNSLKYSAQVERPDGTDLRSFPSGHTATAFMTATMLAKEYGFRSPWVGIGAYTVAAATGLMRMANNKHWLSDVMTGAGVGIVSTELGYYLAELIFIKHGLNTSDINETFDKLHKPSFLGINFLVNDPLGSYLNEKGAPIKISRGCSTSAEGAYFFNPYIGIGGRLSVTRASVIVDGVKTDDNVFDAWKISGGAYFSYPLSARWLLGSQLLVSSVFFPNIKLTDDLIDTNHGIAFGTGLSLTFRVRRNYNIRFLVDYNLQPYRTSGVRDYFHSLGIGSSYAISF